MTYGFGPTGPRAATSRPADDADPYGIQTWFKDASAKGARDGTVIKAAWLNRFIGERLHLASASGVPPAGNVSQDAWLTDAIRAYMSLRIAAEVTGQSVRTLIDDVEGNTDWRKRRTGPEVVQLLDDQLGGVEWRDLTLPASIAALEAGLAALGGEVDAIDLAYAPKESPALTGIPTAPTAAPGTNSEQLATTAYVVAAIGQLIGAAPGLLDTLDEIAAALADDPNFATTMTTALALKAPLASPAFTGNPTAPTQAGGDNSLKIANTAWVRGEVDIKAPLASPSFTGTPTAPTPAPGDNTTKIATTAYVDAADALKAPLASPTFTGTPAAPTPASGDNSTKIATTAYVDGAIAAIPSVGEATPSTAGLMSAADKTKLDAVGSMANRAVTVSASAPTGGADGDVWLQI